jgi:hypothetical protein
MSRFCHIDFKPTVEEFIGYAESKGADVIADFIRNHNEMLVKERKSEFEGTKLGVDMAHKRNQVDVQKGQIAAQLIAAEMNARNNKGNDNK